jgi:hypothetical protein
MSKQHPRDGEQPELIEIIFELPPSTQGTYQYEREDGATAHGDASGKWTLDKNGEVEDIVLFMSPGWHRKKRRGEGA